jgi:hypothetical protein
MRGARTAASARHAGWTDDWRDDVGGATQEYSTGTVPGTAARLAFEREFSSVESDPTARTPLPAVLSVRRNGIKVTFVTSVGWQERKQTIGGLAGDAVTVPKG